MKTGAVWWPDAKINGVRNGTRSGHRIITKLKVKDFEDLRRRGGA